jgi:hypothetical protein
MGGSRVTIARLDTNHIMFLVELAIDRLWRLLCVYLEAVMALATDALCVLSSSSCSSFSASRDVELTLAAKPSGRSAGGLKASRLVVRAAGPKKRQSGVEHHRDGDSKPELPPKFGLKWLETGGELMGLKMEELVRGGHGVLFGSRIPKHYFMTKGFGQTDQGDGSDPWETGSYDLALEDAGD